MNAAQHMLVAALRLYRVAVSPILTAVFGPLGCGCRFHPTCSRYAIDAVQTHGVLRGALLAGWRLCRCHPFGGSGHDPVPEVLPWRKLRRSGLSIVPATPVVSVPGRKSKAELCFYDQARRCFETSHYYKKAAPPELSEAASCECVGSMQTRPSAAS